MSTKFWVCIAVLSVFTAHCYVYTDFFAQDDIKRVTGMADYTAEFWKHMAKTKQRLKFELRTVLEVGKQMTVVGRKILANFRKQQEQKKAKQRQTS